MSITAELPQPVTNMESHMGGESLYESFYDGLRLAVAVERKYACTVMGIDPQSLKDIDAHFNLNQLGQMHDKLRDLFSGQAITQKYDAITSKAMDARTADDPDKYGALNNPELRSLAVNLARTGIMLQVGQHRIDMARAERHKQSRGSGSRMAMHGVDRAIRQASSADELIKINHFIRDFIDTDSGRAMNLDRDKVRKILRTILPGDIVAADGLEDGLALEIAAYRVLRRIVPVKPGDLNQDKIGGDYVLFPGMYNQTLVDIKQTPPNGVRQHLSDEELRTPGYSWKTNGSAYLWLGSGESVGNNYRVPLDFIHAAQRLSQEAAAQAIA